jgi:hypothetical protein
MRKLTLALALAMFLLLPVLAHAGTMSPMLGWTASSSTSVTGYKLYYGTASGTYGTPIDAGKNLTQTISGLSDAANAYYFAATAYNATQESAKSTELVAYTLKASAGTNGTINPSGSFLTEANSTTVFSIIPASGYSVGVVTVDGTSVGSVTTYTTDNTGPHTISATFVAALSPPGQPHLVNPPTSRDHHHRGR